jgi:Methylase involved in ubiquinone/menaquinone biosynthesis
MNMELQQSWNKRAQMYANRMDKLMNSLEYQNQWKENLQLLLGSCQGLEILDIGTGSGFLAFQLVRLGQRVIGLDFSEEMLRIAESKAQSLNLDCSFVFGNAVNLPFPAERFDTIVCRHLLYSLNDRSLVFTEWLRVLRSGGRVAIWDGDWTARNMLPFAQLQLTSKKQIPRRYATIKRQGAFKREQEPNMLHNEVIMELKAAGFINIKIFKMDIKNTFGDREIKLECECLFITAQRP